MDDDYRLHYIVTAFIDLMGQKDRTLQLDHLPQDEQERTQAIDVLRGTLGVVQDIRHKLRSGIEKYRDFNLDDRPDLPQDIRDSQRFELNVFEHGFSDSFILAVPLDNRGRPDQALTSVRMMISSVAAVMLDSLSQSRPLRGGLDVAVGIRLENDELYGPALVRPYLLESRFANYPRVVVGEAMRTFLEAHRDAPSTTRADGLARVHADKILTMLSRDTDGLNIVDWLGPMFVPPLARRGDLKRHVDAALTFSERERVRFLERGEATLGRRYTRLATYIRSRVPKWESPGVSP